MNRPPSKLLLLAVAGSASLAIFGALALPVLLFAFKPLTSVLILALAGPRGTGMPAVRRWVLAGLALSLLGDIALLWPKQGFLPGLVAFLLAHLAYIVAFTRDARFAQRPLVFGAYAVVAGAILSLLWPGVPPDLRVPVIAYVLCLAAMAAQAASRWRAEPADPWRRRAAVGGALFMASDALLATDRFGTPLPAAPLLILATYWAAQVAIATSLRPRG